MIKLVATDLDGTLLDREKQIPPHFNRAVEMLYDRGVRFAIASGRQYYNIRKLFYGIREKLFFICENGAIIFDGDRNIFSEAISFGRLARPLAAIRTVPTAAAVLCGVDCAYLPGGNEECEAHAADYYERIIRTESLLDAAQNDRICKIALFDSESTEKNLWPLRHSFGAGFQMALSGRNWLDLMNRGVHKGAALRRLQARLNITPLETMTFGDYLNDTEMMRESYYSYAMANAHPGLAAVCNFSAPPNSENGVMRVLEATFQFDRFQN